MYICFISLIFASLYTYEFVTHTDECVMSCTWMGPVSHMTTPPCVCVCVCLFAPRCVCFSLRVVSTRCCVQNPFTFIFSIPSFTSFATLHFNTPPPPPPSRAHAFDGCCSVVQCVAVWCSVLRCGAVCCGVCDVNKVRLCIIMQKL